MRILSLCKSTGGLARYNENLVCRLAEIDHMTVEVACLSEGRAAYAERLRRRGLRVHEIDMPRYSIAPLRDARAALAVLRLLRSGGYDIVIGHGTKAGFLARFCGRLAGVPSVYRLASLSFVRRTQGRRAAIFRWLERLGSRFGGTIVTVCEASRQAVLAHRVAPAERVVTILTGIDPEQWRDLPERRAAGAALGLDPARFTVGWAARMNEQKDPEAFLDAVRRVVATHPAVQFCMAGDGPLRAAIEHHVAAMHLPITLVPWQEDMRRFLAVIDVFVLTSRWEGVPLAVLEAMAARRTVVATPVDGTPEVLRHDTEGLLATSSAEIAACVGVLYERPERRATLADAAFRRIESELNAAGMVRKWVVTLRQVAGEDRHADPAQRGVLAPDRYGSSLPGSGSDRTPSRR